MISRWPLCRIGVLAFTLLTLDACVTKNIGQDYVLDESSGNGVVVGSITYSGTYGEYDVYYRKLGGGAEGHFQFGHFDVALSLLDKDDIESADVQGDVFAAALPAGNYEIYRWSVSSGYAHIEPAVPFSVYFTIEPGKIVYLGNFHFQRTTKVGLMVTGVSAKDKDESERDLKIFAAKYPAFSKVTIGSAIEKGESYNDLGATSRATITIPIYVYH